VQASAIMAAVLINALLGFFTELKAKMSLDALEHLAGPTCRVVRDGKQQELPARQLVPGDLVILDAGDRVPADLTLVEAVALSIEESMLTGESIPVYKQTGVDDPDSEEKNNLAFQGTLVLSGRARGVVNATGNNTKLGRLGRLLSETVNTRTPLEEQLEKLGQQLTWLTLILCALLFVVGLINRSNVWLLMQTSIALAVAAIPEGMPVVATLALAAGTRRMIKAGALIRQLAAVETLGCTTVICSDKTGTLTENQMLVTDLVLPGRHINVTGHGYEPIGDLTENGTPVISLDDVLLVDLLRNAALCNDAKLECHDGESGWHVHGDPTEGAILTVAHKIGLKQEDLRYEFPRIFEIPFDLNRKRMTTVHSVGGHVISCTKGSPGTMLSLCSSVRTTEGIVALDESNQAWFNTQNAMLAANGLRVLAVATKQLPGRSHQFESAELETDLTLLGLVAMSDQPRARVRESIEACKNAGIKVIMVTGDQAPTAAAIGHNLGLIELASSSEKLVTGKQLENLADDAMESTLKHARILARVSPDMKLNVVQRLQHAGEIVAMTGDGVNDAPALRQANIGVAMGLSGTALAREAANMVITDDNFATITKAVEQGRIIYNNIRQSVAYLLTASLASVMSVFALVMLGESAPFSPLELLWLNLIMHIFPGLALVLQPASSGIMERPPRKPDEPLLTGTIQIQILLRSLVVTAAVLSAMKISAALNSSEVHTVGFSTLALSLILQALSWALARSAR
ncbi:MAG: cation-translocating P-type ATPase, partial [Cyanobacteria bacterium]|nr:cation-translocating P-type ATPase [Cyanobacteriota bacterium]